MKAQLPTRLVVLLALGLGVMPSARAWGQSGPTPPADTLYRIRLTDGSNVVGRIASRNESALVVVTVNDIRMELPRTQVRDVRVAQGRIVNGEYWSPDPNHTRLFFAPTARSVGAGEGYVGTFMLGLPFVSVGVTDRITLAGGAPVLFGKVDPIYIAPKIQLVAEPGVGVAVGVLSAFSNSSDDLQSLGVAFGVATLGNPDQAITFGIGWGYAGKEVANRPVLSIGGEARVSRRIKLLTENYIVAGESGSMLTGGIRILGERLTTDIGMLRLAADGESFCCVPIINFAYGFGSRR